MQVWYTTSDTSLFEIYKLQNNRNLVTIYSCLLSVTKNIPNFAGFRGNYPFGTFFHTPCTSITQLKACRNKQNQGWVTSNTMQGQDQRLKLRNAYNIITKILKTNTVCLCSLNSSPASPVHIESFSCILS
jgi:hypothetical protein